MIHLITAPGLDLDCDEKHSNTTVHLDFSLSSLCGKVRTAKSTNPRVKNWQEKKGYLSYCKSRANEVDKRF